MQATTKVAENLAISDRRQIGDVLENECFRPQLVHQPNKFGNQVCAVVIPTPTLPNDAEWLTGWTREENIDAADLGQFQYLRTG